MCTKLRGGVLVGLPPGHRRQAVKSPRAPFSWKPSAESEKKSAMVRSQIIGKCRRTLRRWCVITRGKERESVAKEGYRKSSVG